MASLLDLPTEILIGIFEYNTSKSILSIRLVCNFFYKLTTDEYFWKQLCQPTSVPINDLSWFHTYWFQKKIRKYITEKVIYEYSLINTSSNIIAANYTPVPRHIVKKVFEIPPDWPYDVAYFMTYRQTIPIIERPLTIEIIDKFLEENPNMIINLSQSPLDIGHYYCKVIFLAKGLPYGSYPITSLQYLTPLTFSAGYQSESILLRDYKIVKIFTRNKELSLDISEPAQNILASCTSNIYQYIMYRSYASFHTHTKTISEKLAEFESLERLLKSLD